MQRINAIRERGNRMRIRLISILLLVALFASGCGSQDRHRHQPHRMPNYRDRHHLPGPSHPYGQGLDLVSNPDFGLKYYWYTGHEEEGWCVMGTHTWRF